MLYSIFWHFYYILSMVHWLLYLIHRSPGLCPRPWLTDCYIFCYRSPGICPHPWLTDCYFFIVHLFYVHIHGSLSVIYIVSFTCSMSTSMAHWLWYLFYRSLVLCPHPFLAECYIYCIVHLFYAHIHGSLIVIFISSFTCSMLTSMAHWLWYLFYRSLVLCPHPLSTDYITN